MLLSCIAYAVIPIYTLLFVKGTNWFTSNLSVIGSWPNRRTTALFLLLLAVTIPYLPDSVPLQAFLHVVFAFTASLLLGLCLYLVLWRLSSISEAAHKILRPYRISMVAITFISAMLLLIAGIISSALEIFFIITTTILVQRLYVLSSCIFSN